MSRFTLTSKLFFEEEKSDNSTQLAPFLILHSCPNWFDNIVLPSPNVSIICLSFASTSDAWASLRKASRFAHLAAISRLDTVFRALGAVLAPVVAHRVAHFARFALVAVVAHRAARLRFLPLSITWSSSGVVICCLRHTQLVRAVHRAQHLHCHPAHGPLHQGATLGKGCEATEEEEEVEHPCLADQN